MHIGDDGALLPSPPSWVSKLSNYPSSTTILPPSKLPSYPNCQTEPYPPLTSPKYLNPLHPTAILPPSLRQTGILPTSSPNLGNLGLTLSLRQTETLLPPSLRQISILYPPPHLAKLTCHPLTNLRFPSLPPPGRSCASMIEKDL